MSGLDAPWPNWPPPKPSLSLVIPTAALTDQTARGLSYAFRAYLLRNFVLPQAIASGAFREILVVGEFEAGTGYTYLPCSSVERSNVSDAIRKRHIGTRAATGDWICVLNDDHIFDPQFFTRFAVHAAVADVVSPARWTRLRHADGEQLNGGEPGGRWSGAGHLNGHCCVFKRAVLECCPWHALPWTFTYDVVQTERIREAGFHIVWSPDVIVWDVEHGATPWR